MPETIDGSCSLSEQESAIQFKEAKGYELVKLEASEEAPPCNVAEFKKLPIGERPKRIHLTLVAPDEEAQIWTGKIFIKSKITQAYARRK